MTTAERILQRVGLTIDEVKALRAQCGPCTLSGSGPAWVKATSHIPKFCDALLDELERPAEKQLEMLARRAYPELKYSGYCSAHREDRHFECETCYPDLNALLDAHMKVQQKLYEELLKLSGLSDPPNGRIGTNAIIAEIRRQMWATTA